MTSKQRKLRRETAALPVGLLSSLPQFVVGSEYQRLAPAVQAHYIPAPSGKKYIKVTHEYLTLLASNLKAENPIDWRRPSLAQRDGQPNRATSSLDNARYAKQEGATPARFKRRRNGTYRRAEVTLPPAGTRCPDLHVGPLGVVPATT